jgi:hypothetical protein
MPGSETLGGDFAHALAAKDFERIADLFHPEIDFRGLTPNREWQAEGSARTISEILKIWFEDSDHIEALEQLETGQVGDRQRLGYRFTVRNPEGRFVVEQQAYLHERDGQIGWMRVVCSGFRPLD